MFGFLHFVLLLLAHDLQYQDVLLGVGLRTTLFLGLPLSVFGVIQEVEEGHDHARLPLRLLFVTGLNVEKSRDQVVLFAQDLQTCSQVIRVLIEVQLQQDPLQVPLVHVMVLLALIIIQKLDQNFLWNPLLPELA